MWKLHTAFTEIKDFVRMMTVNSGGTRRRAPQEGGNMVESRTEQRIQRKGQPHDPFYTRFKGQ